MGKRRFSRNARFSVGLALIFSIYSLSILGFCIGASGSLSRIAGALGLQQQSRQSIQGIQGSLGLRRSIVAVAPLRAKKKKVDPEREAKRRAAAEKRELAKRKAEEEKRKLAGLDPLPPAPPPTRAVKKPAVAKPPALPPVPVRSPAKGRRKKGVDPEREAKRMRAAEAREEAKRRAEEERQKLQVQARKTAEVKHANGKVQKKSQADQSVKEIDFTKLTVVEIKEELRKRGLKVSGKKQELIQRLQGKEASQGGDDSGSQAPEYAKMKVAELREELKKLGEKTTGRKAELVERLAACQTSNAKGTPSVGQKFRGKVAGLSKWGAFVDIGLSRPALVRTSRLAERHVRDASEVVQSGEEVDVWVYRVAPDGRLGLSMIEYPSSKLQDPVSAFEGVSSRKWFKGVVRYQADREFFVDVLAPQGAGVQGKLAKSAVSSPEKVSAGQELEVRVLEVIANTGTLRLSAKPPI